jgi:hypothetical protein
MAGFGWTKEYRPSLIVCKRFTLFACHSCDVCSKNTLAVGETTACDRHVKRHMLARVDQATQPTQGTRDVHGDVETE